MHKKEASELFKVLGNEDRVKIMKMLYNRGKLTFSELLQIIGCDNAELTNSLNILIGVDLVSYDGNEYSCNKDHLNELLSFIVTPCGCTR